MAMWFLSVLLENDRGLPKNDTKKDANMFVSASSGSRSTSSNQ